MMTKDNLIEALDDILPQTQCGLCGYGGCRPYAEAIALQKEAINKCPPGGVKVLVNVANLTQQDATPYIEEMQRKTKPPSRAVIREAECIGCTKCIQACPVDAIIGSAKQMHSVITEECTGCELCIEPCPVDCIELVQVQSLPEEVQKEKSNLARARFNFRTKRLEAELLPSSFKPTKSLSSKEEIQSRKTALQEAIARVKAKKAQLNEC